MLLELKYNYQLIAYILFHILYYILFVATLNFRFSNSNLLFANHSKIYH